MKTAIPKLILLIIFGCHLFRNNNLASAANVPLTTLEQEALLSIREGFIGFPANWLASTVANPCGKWTGIGCNAAGIFNRIQLTGRVRILNLQY